MSSPLVSVVVPAYNQQALLREALVSALSQTVRDIEVVVVDDGSSDETRQVCADLADDRVVYQHQANDGTRGIGARNAAMLLARGVWVAPLDQDDVWLPEKLERQLACAAREPGAAAVFCRTQFIDGAGAVRGEQVGPLPTGDVFHLLLAANRYYVSTGMFRRDLIARMGLPHESVGLGDWALWLSVARHASVTATDDLLVQYRTHEHGYQASQLAYNQQAFWEDHWLLARFASTRVHPDCLACDAALGELCRVISGHQARTAVRRLLRRRFDSETRRNLRLAWAAQPRPWSLAVAASRRALLLRAAEPGPVE